MAEIFDKLGIYGMSVSNEEAILTSMLTGDPILLIGKQGTAKTGLVEAMGAAIREYSKKLHPDDESKWFKYHSYDSSKLNFEDLVGFPDVEGMKKGKIDFIPSPMTAWDKDLICFDEFNRQEPSRQNNIFELIRNRTLCGMPTKCSWVINCMNPFGMAGTEELDEALVDRHMFFIYMTDYNQLSSDNKLNVIKRIGGSDSPALQRVWNITESSYKSSNNGGLNEELATSGQLIYEILQKASELLADTMKESGTRYASFIEKFIASINNSAYTKKGDTKLELSGRRAGMLWRGMMGYRAIQQAKCHILNDYKLRPGSVSATEVIAMALPIGLSSGNTMLSNDVLVLVENTVNSLAGFFESDGGIDAVNSDNLDLSFKLMTTNKIAEKIEILMHYDNDDVKIAAWSRILNKFDEDIKHNLKSSAALTVAVAGTILPGKPNIVPESFRARVTKAAIDLSSLHNNDASLIRFSHNTIKYSDKIMKAIDRQTSNFQKAQGVILTEEFITKCGSRYVGIGEIEEFIFNLSQACNALGYVMAKHEIKDVSPTKITNNKEVLNDILTV